MDVFLSIIAGLVIVALLNVINPSRKAAPQMSGDAEEMSPEDCRMVEASYLAVEVLKRAYKSLEEQKGAGYGPWISSCLQRAQGGMLVEPGAALMAIRWTIHELEWSRFNLTGLKRAENELEGLAG